MAKETGRRQVKLQGKYRPLINHYNGGRQIPWLNVSGVWLEEAGFKTGDRVEIRIEQQQLIIKNLSADGDPRN